MKRISELYKYNGKWYDYPISHPDDEKLFHHDCLAKQGKTIKVYHQDGTFTVGYMFGEKQFTYSEEELIAHRAEYKQSRAILHNRNQMLAKIATYNDETLARIIKMIEG